MVYIQKGIICILTNQRFRQCPVNKFRGTVPLVLILNKKDEKTKMATPPYRTEDEKKELASLDTSGGFLQEPMLQFPEGARIKQNIGNALTTTYPLGNYSGIFDGIDEKTVENNIPLAESVIEKNTQSGSYKLALPEKLPYLHDGMALFYAAAEQGNTKAADAARKIAYTPHSKTPKNTSRIRYAGEDKVRFYTDASIKSDNVDLLSLGDEMLYLGEKKKSDGVEWAKVKYGGKTGWVNSEYLKTSKSAVKGDTFSYLTNELTNTDINAGLKVVEKNNEFYYDYTDVVMNRLNTVLPEFDNQRVISYEDYVEEFTPKLFGKFYFGQPTMEEYYAAVMNKLYFFYNQVNHGEPWDIKRDPSWKMQFGDIRMPYYDGTESKNEKFLFRGELVTREDLGNITYGYLGSAMGLGEKTLYWGAGVANDWKKGIFEGKAYDEENFYGDEKEDFKSVTKGIKLYYEDYPEAKPGINRTFP